MSHISKSFWQSESMESCIACWFTLGQLWWSFVYLLMCRNHLITKVWRCLTFPTLKINHQSERHNYYSEIQRFGVSRDHDPGTIIFSKGITTNDVSKASSLPSRAWIPGQELATNLLWVAWVWLKSHFNAFMFHKPCIWVKLKWAIKNILT